MKRAILSAALALGLGHAATAGDKPVIAPAPSWVVPAAIPTAPPSGSSALEVLLSDAQIRFEPNATDFYEERAIKVRDPVGLAQAGTFSMPWRPDVATLTIHRARILRGDKVIDLIDHPDRVTVLRREPNLETSMLDGALTAVIQPEGLQAGDILDYAFTLTVADPLTRGHAEGFGEAPSGLPAQRYRLRAIWPSGRPMQWRMGSGLGQPIVSHPPGLDQFLVERANFEAPSSPAGAPPRFQHPGQTEFTDFRDWGEVSVLLTPAYERAADLAKDSAVRAEAAKIAASTDDPKKRAALALQLVQQQVRYFYLELGAGGYAPAAADLTWTRRFGDCKGKTVLLIALLRALGIDAAPALVSTTGGDRLPVSLPAIAFFDHVIVRAHIGGVTYWLDGTRLGDREIKDILPPDYQWALPLVGRAAKLEPIEEPPLAEPAAEVETRIDLRGGPDAPAPTRVTVLYRGDLALSVHQGYDATAKADLNKKLRESFTATYPWITIQNTGAKWDEAGRTLTINLEGTGHLTWTTYASGRQYIIPDSQLGGEVSLERANDADKSAPYAIPYPMFIAGRTSITLPDRGAGYTLEGGGDVDREIAGIQYRRKSAIVGGTATLEVTTKSLKREIPADAAPAAESALQTLNEQPVWLEAPLASAPKPSTPAPASKTSSAALAEPSTAEGFARRGLQLLVEHDYSGAVVDLSRAAELDPNVEKTFYNRGVAYAALGKFQSARDDFDRALRLNPKSSKALAARGRMRLELSDEDGARADFEAAFLAAPTDPEPLWQAALAMDDAGQFGAAVGYYNRLLMRFSTDSRRSSMLNARCWARAQWGRELRQGLSDCEAAISLSPKSSSFLDSRALVELRLGHAEDSIKDYNAAIAGGSGAVSLFGRGLAKLKSGDSVGGSADIAAATKSDPDVANRYAKWGLRP
ncbi:MAG TPA: DUF3857 domain-containing protein [Caulobacteraceae bacterium]|jgi:tetratricopeptide (TPR) repeat protein/transglutaminase-like putative cysteine protease